VLDPMNNSWKPDAPCDPMTIKSTSFFLLTAKMPSKAFSNWMIYKAMLRTKIQLLH
jgi:hypothetical protein